MKVKKELITGFIIGLIIFIFFFPALNFPWRHFDEQIIYKETLLPVSLSFSQLIEYIKYFGLKNYIEASNPFYTSVANTRCAPFGSLFFLVIFFLFQKSAFAYHLLSVLLHTANSILCFFILNKTSLIITQNTKTPVSVRLIVVILLTLFWGLHPVNLETILLASNIGALVTYFFCFFFIFCFINIQEKNIKLNLQTNIAIGILYLIPLLLNEYSVTLPLILLVYFYLTSAFYLTNSSRTKIILSVFKILIPVFFALIIFSIYFISLPKINIFQSCNLKLALERIIWFSPQIFVHFLKLILSPLHLTIDQSSLVRISNLLINPYSITCITLMYGLIVYLIFGLFKPQKSFFFFPAVIFFPLFLSLVPFLHIISPLYNLASERYLYFPTFLFTLGLLHLLFFLFRKLNKKFTLILLTITAIISACFIYRAYLRMFDWKDGFSLFQSAVTESREDLIKGLRLQMLGGLYFLNQDKESKIKGQEYINNGTKILEQLLKDIEKNYDKIPEIIYFYGLDSKSKQAKAGYLLALSKIGLENNSESAYSLLKPYINQIAANTQILDFYLGILFVTKRFAEAEEIINSANKKRTSPVIFIADSYLQRIKYNDFTKAENLLKESFKYFPYDTRTLEELKNFYLQINNAENYAFYSFLHGLREHSINSLTDSYRIYKRLNNTQMANIVFNNIEILKKKMQIS